MGLIKAALGAAGGVLADSWKEYFYCDALDKDTLVVKGQRKTSSRSSNKSGEDNIISNGSVIAVADGQFMIIVEQGKVVEACGEPGEFTWDSSTEPSIFTGSLGETILETFKQVGKRFTFGGDTGKDQRVYYFNTKEITDNKFGTANPIPFRVVDSKIGLDIDVSLRCNGIYSYKIADPLKFYAFCGNVASNYRRSELDSTLKTEFISALQPMFARLSAMEIRPNEVIAHNTDIERLMNEALTEKWFELRGLKVASVAFGSVTLPEEDQELIKTAQKTAMYRDPTMAAANLVTAQADAMRTAAGNSSGAMQGFMGMGMAMNQGGMNAQSLFAMGQQKKPQQPQPQSAPAPKANEWLCSCGTKNDGKFCVECGAKKPEDGWKCSCGAVNKGKFCPECGAKKPAGAKLYRCDKCGWEPEDPAKPPKFCPECGDLFNDDDAK